MFVLKCVVLQNRTYGQTNSVTRVTKVSGVMDKVSECGSKVTSGTILWFTFFGPHLWFHDYPCFFRCSFESWHIWLIFSLFSCILYSQSYHTPVVIEIQSTSAPVQSTWVIEICQYRVSETCLQMVFLSYLQRFFQEIAVICSFLGYVTNFNFVRFNC